jgi:peptidoglycan/LPS O-acetylase OafA/YrhL
MGQLATVSNSSVTSGHIPSLDGWRALAIVMVIITHFRFLVRCKGLGRHGVGVFFVLSGYLITTVLMKEWEKNGHIDLRSFYIRRFFRLMPTAWTLLALYFLCHVIDLRELASCVFFYRNYLSHVSTLATDHFWSLSIEEQFYLVWPWILVFAGPRWARNVAIAGACLVAAYRFMNPTPDFVLQTQFHADALFVGCFFALTSRLPRMPSVVFWLSALTVGACAVGPFFFGPPFWDSILIGWMIHTTALGGIPLAQKVLNWQPIATIGVMSYSLYIWQSPMSRFPLNTYVEVSVILVVLAALTILTYTFIENPSRRLGARIAERLKRPVPTVVEAPV